MKNATKFAPWVFLGTVIVMVWCFSVFPTAVSAQSQGNNAVYYQSGSSGTCCKGSGAFIDASVFTALSQTFCSTLYNILSASSYPSSTGTVIDARGLNSNNTTMKCATGTTPWNNGSTSVNVPSTILLPAGTIVIPLTWSLPPNTALIGVGDNIGSGTTLQASANSFSVGTPMIEFGSSSLCTSTCSGISVENLNLDGQGQAINGIANGFSRDLSYVDHVTLYQILGTGLSVLGNASHSGPYSNITFDTGAYSGVSATTCASINGLTDTRGFHHWSCKSETNDAAAGILLDSSNNTLEDVRLIGFYDGIRVGANATAQSNVLLNVYGDTVGFGSGLTPINTVHIESSSYTVTDLSITGLGNVGGTGTVTLKDDLTSTQLSGTSDPYVAVYALGKSANGGHSRFTTSPNAPTWGVGSSAPGSTSCSPGSLYSNTGGSPKALYVCLGSTSQWSGIK
ncbi:MAG: hypothetical protein WB711_14155 [Terriglobales bacterium]